MLSVGLFVSTLTESQFVSALITFVIVLTMFLFKVFTSTVNIGFVADVIEWFSLFSRFDVFVYGLIDISTIIYYLSFAGLFVFLSVVFIQKKRWN